MMQGLAGWMSLTGEPDGPPTKSGLSLVDLSGGYVSAIAVLAGLWRARRDGVGCDCDVSLFETALHSSCTSAPGPRRAGSAAAAARTRRTRRSSRSRTSRPPTAGSSSPPRSRSSGSALRGARAPGPRRGPALRDFAGRDGNRDELLPILEEAFRARTRRVGASARRGGRAGAPREHVAEALVDPQTVAREASSRPSTRRSARRAPGPRTPLAAARDASRRPSRSHGPRGAPRGHTERC